jgi:hypothetical protein
MDNNRPWWAILLTWRFWGPVLGGIMLLGGIVAVTVFLLKGDVTGALWVFFLWLISFLLALIVVRVLGSRG